MQQLGHPHACTNLLLPGGATSSPCRHIPWLHLKYSAEEVFRGDGEEPDLSIPGVEAIEVGALWREVLINVGVVAAVVQVGRGSKPRGARYSSPSSGKTKVTQKVTMEYIQVLEANCIRRVSSCFLLFSSF